MLWRKEKLIKIGWGEGPMRKWIFCQNWFMSNFFSLLSKTIQEVCSWTFFIIKMKRLIRLIFDYIRTCYFGTNEMTSIWMLQIFHSVVITEIHSHSFLAKISWNQRFTKEITEELVWRNINVFKKFSSRECKFRVFPQWLNNYQFILA